MTRREAREFCFKLMFEYEVQKNDFDMLMAEFDEYAEKPGKQREYVERVVSACLTNLAEIDEKIEQHSNGWKIGRLPKVSLSVLRVAICEILFMEDIPDGIAINEAVEIAKVYHDEKNGKFVNGILSSVLKGK